MDELRTRVEAVLAYCRKVEAEGRNYEDFGPDVAEEVRRLLGDVTAVVPAVGDPRQRVAGVIREHQVHTASGLCGCGRAHFDTRNGAADLMERWPEHVAGAILASDTQHTLLAARGLL